MSEIKIITFYFFCIWFHLSPIHAKENKNPPLQLDILIKNVIKHNPDLEAARSRIKAAAIAIPRVQVLDDPNLLIRSLSNPLKSRSDAFQREMRVEFSQRLPFPGKLKLKGKIAEQQRNFLYYQEITTQEDLTLTAKKLYFQLFFNRTAIQINTYNRNITKRLIEGALSVYKTGKGKQADVLKGQVELQMLEEELFILESDQATLIAMINTLLDSPQSSPVGEPLELFHPIVSFDYEQLETIALNNRSELHSIQALIQEQKERANLARREFYPDFKLSFRWQRKPNQKADAWGVALELNLPVWIEQRQRREMREAETKASANTSSLYNMYSIIRGRIKEILAKISAAEERILLYKTSLLSKVTETLVSNEIKYQVGKEDFLTVLDTRRQLQNFELAYERARIEREILLAELERETAVPIERMLSLMSKSNTPSTTNKKLTTPNQS